MLQGSVVGIYTGWAMRELDPRWADRTDDLAIKTFAPERWLTEEGKNQVRADWSECKSNNEIMTGLAIVHDGMTVPP